MLHAAAATESTLLSAARLKKLASLLPRHCIGGGGMVEQQLGSKALLG